VPFWQVSLAESLEDGSSSAFLKELLHSLRGKLAPDIELTNLFTDRISAPPN
jgi:hypothetical protein